MKNTKLLSMQSRLLCAIALLAIIAFSVAACSSDNENVSLPGTTWKWAGTEKGIAYTMTLTFTANTFRLVAGGGKTGTITGTYTFNGNSGTLKASNGDLEPISVSGNKLTMKDRQGNYTFTRQ